MLCRALGCAVISLLATAACATSGALASSVEVEEGVLLVEASEGERNEVAVERSAGEFHVSDTIGLVAGASCVQSSPSRAVCSATGVSNVRVSSRDLDDRVSFNGFLGAGVGGRIEGGSGSDALAGSEGSDALHGGDGLDEVAGREGDDRIEGSAGEDSIDGGSGSDTYDLRSESRLNWGELEGSMMVASGFGRLETDELTAMENILAGPGTATVIGTDAPNRFVGSGAVNSFLGGAGRDVFEIGPNDPRFGVGGWNAADTVYPGPGDDVVRGDASSPYVVVSYATAAGPVAVDLTAGTARGEGEDALTDVAGAQGSPGADVLVGDDDDNLLIGLEGDDAIEGVTGDDLIQPGSGDDVAIGGEGVDEVSYSNGTHDSLEISLADGRATGDGMDAIRGFESATGGFGFDTIEGDAGENTLDGEDGNDVVMGGAGDDVLVEGGTGHDRLDAGAGDDFLAGNEGSDNLIAGPGDDRLLGRGGADVFEGGEGADAMIGDTYDDEDTVVFDQDGDPVSVDLAAGSASGQGDDTLVAIDAIRGTAGSDQLLGNDSGNQIDGRGGDDRIAGRGEDDLLDGGDGRDDVDGGSGDDRLQLVDGAADDATCGDGDSDTAFLDEVDLVDSTCEHTDRPGPPSIELLSGPTDGSTVGAEPVEWRFELTDADEAKCALDGGRRRDDPLDQHLVSLAEADEACLDAHVARGRQRRLGLTGTGRVVPVGEQDDALLGVIREQRRRQA